MITYLPVIILAIIVLISGASGINFDDYNKILVVAPNISQIFTNPELSDSKDIDLHPDTQIRLYEQLTHEICTSLSTKYPNVGFVDNLSKMKAGDADWLNGFNQEIPGKVELSDELKEKYFADSGYDAILNSALMFSYYENPDSTIYLEVLYEWYLIDLDTGKSIKSKKYRCEDQFNQSEDISTLELACFEGILTKYSGKGW